MEHGVLMHTTKQLSKQITYDCGVFIPVHGTWCINECRRPSDV